MRLGVWVLVVGSSAIGLCAQSTSDTATIRAVVREVNVDVMVQDKRSGAPVEGLPQSAFEVLDNGKPQKVTYFSHGKQARPLAVMLIVHVDFFLFDRDFYAKELPAAMRGALTQLRPDDAVGLMVEPTLRQDGRLTPDGSVLLQPLTTDRQKVIDGLERLGQWVSASPQDFGLARDYDIGKTEVAALLRATDALRQSSPSRHTVVVAITPNTNGTLHVLYFDQGMRQLADTDVTVNGLEVEKKGVAWTFIKGAGAIEAGNPAERSNSVQHASAATGGEMVKVENGDYSAALAKAVGDVKACYSLGFVPQSMDGKQHKLEVRVTPPGSDGQSRKLVVRARRGYLAGDAEGVAKAVR